MSQINLLCAEAPHIRCVLAAFGIEINYFWIMFHYGFTTALSGCSGGPRRVSRRVVKRFWGPSDCVVMDWFWKSSPQRAMNLPGQLGSQRPSGSPPGWFSPACKSQNEARERPASFWSGHKSQRSAARETSVIKLTFLPQRSTIIRHRDSALPLVYLGGREGKRVIYHHSYPGYKRAFDKRVDSTALCDIVG